MLSVIAKAYSWICFGLFLFLAQGCTAYTRLPLKDEGTILITAGKNRMRPIAMTTFAAILALMPLALGIGQGAAMQQPLAIAIEHEGELSDQARQHRPARAAIDIRRHTTRPALLSARNDGILIPEEQDHPH